MPLSSQDATDDLDQSLVVIADTTTGLKAKVDAKGTGENALHVKASLDAGSVVTIVPLQVGERYFEFFKNGGSDNLLVNGSVTPVVFTIPLDATKAINISEIRIFGGGNGIKYGKFLSQNSMLTNGVLVEFKAQNIPNALPALKATEDFKNIFTRPDANNFRVDIQSGEDQFISILRFDVPLILKPTGTYSPDDFIKITIRDNLTSGIASLEAIAIGRKDA